MFIFEITPDWLYHTLFYGSLVATLLGFFLRRIPLVNRYSTLLKWGGLTTLAFAIFLEGALYDYNVMQARISEIKQQVEQYENQTKVTNDNLADKGKRVKEKIKIKKEYITRYIDREVTKYDNTCAIPKPFVDAHNQAAEKAK